MTEPQRRGEIGKDEVPSDRGVEGSNLSPVTNTSQEEASSRLAFLLYGFGNVFAVCRLVPV